MSRYDFAAQRLYVEAQLAAGARLELDRARANYLLNVLRLGAGDEILVFNGRDGEWRARLEPDGRKSGALVVAECARPQPGARDVDYVFAPLKHARLDYMAQKAVEMGATTLRPVVTRRTQAARVNLDRLRANAIEAAEQCGVLTLPVVVGETRFDRWLADFPRDRLLVFCDEDADGAPLDVLRAAAPGAPVSVLVGPEGGFDPAERAALVSLPNVLRLSLGPRILRADTAAVAALALVQAAFGDWREG
jgi:16S rRNA (uracil1498-N3)-methyltransferase